MKSKIFILIQFLFVGIFTVNGQQQQAYTEKYLNMMAPFETASADFCQIKLDADPFDNMIQIISTDANRSAASPNGINSPTAIPVNNDCINAISLTVNAACINGTNKEATVQPGESTGCQGAVTKTVWYKFVATNSNMFVEVERTASSGCFLSSAVYNGSCLPSTALACEDAAGGPNLNIHNLTGLTTGTTYFVQVSYTAGGPCGNNNNAGTGADFCIKVGNTQACTTCNVTCGPICVFNSTPTVAQVTSTCTVYELKPRINAGQSKTQCYTFTATASNYSLQMIINSVGCGSGGNVSTFNWQLYPSSCSAAIQSGTLSNLNASGLTIGSAYVLCYTWISTCQHNSVYPYIVATSPLPVELLNFEGRQLDKSILLNWNTASENGNNYFAVQRSADGVSFNELSQIKGAGNSTQTLSYEYNDNTPLSGINYYRLAQFDFDGKMDYSDMIAVKYFENSLIKVENNPVNDQLHIIVQSEKVEYIKLQIVNNLGESGIQTSKFTAKGFNKFSIPVENLSEGVYFVKMESLSRTSWSRFVKL